MSTASYRKLAYAIRPGDIQDINRQGDFFHVLSADGDFSVAWDDGGATPFFAGLEYEVRDGRSFNKVQIINTGQADLNIEVGIGRGGIRDSRLTTSGSVDARDNGGASFDDVVSGLQTVRTGVNETVSGVDALRQEQWLDLNSYTRGFFTANTTIVNEFQNTNGLDVLFAQLSSGSNTTAQLGVGGLPLLQASNGGSVLIERLHIHEGLRVRYEHGGDGCALCIAYRRL
ncbi:hypothetical protein [Yoonia sp. R2-816]|uniref:hypothetical protein n=1 Tax=Yoonia sp. R2-816 TaxID=3342638 RepID=UPI00372CC5D9